jgi:drug/metabolite transporter (DMT)-like permease
MANSNKDEEFKTAEAVKPEVAQDFGIMKLCTLINIMQITYTVSNIVGKTIMLNQGCSIMDFSFFRFLIIQFVSQILLKINGKHPIRDLPNESRTALWIRATVGTTTFTIINVGILLLPLALGGVIIYTAPFFTALLTKFVLKEEVPTGRWFLMAGTFGGVALISFAGTDALTPNHVDENSFFGQFSQTTTYIIGVTSCLVTAMLMSVIITSSRALKPVHYSVVQFWYSLFACIACALIEGVTALMLVIKQNNNPDLVIEPTEWPLVFTNWYTYALIAAAGLVNVPAQNLMTLTNQYGNPSLTVIIGYVAVLYGFLADKFIFGETYNTWQYVGVVIVLGFNIAVVMSAKKS